MPSVIEPESEDSELNPGLSDSILWSAPTSRGWGPMLSSLTAGDAHSHGGHCSNQFPPYPVGFK